MLGLDLSWEAHRPYSTMSPLVCQLYSKDCIHPVTSNCPETFGGFPHSTLYGFKTRGGNCVSLCMSSLVRADCGWWDHRNGVCSYANTSWSPPLHWKASSGTVTAPGLCCISVKKQYCSGRQQWLAQLELTTVFGRESAQTAGHGCVPCDCNTQCHWTHTSEECVPNKAYFSP